MLAKKIIGPQSVIPKVYHVRVAVNQPGYYDASPREFVREEDLERLRRGGFMKRRLHHKQQPSSRETGYIHNHHPHTPTPVPLKSMAQLTWIDSHTLKMVLLEGKKRQIRRLCLDVLHVEVLRLERVGIGEIRIENLPVGKWRPLSEWEVRSLL